MKKSFDMGKEIKETDLKLSHVDFLTTTDCAHLYNLCNRYIKAALGQDILSIFEKINLSPREITSYLIFQLKGSGPLYNYLRHLDALDIMFKTIYAIGNKEILNLSQSVIDNSNKRPHTIEELPDEAQIRRIFKSLRTNYFLYEKLYKGKIWLINTTDNNDNEIGKAKIKISPYMFFHLMGFDYTNILNPNRKGGENEDKARVFAKIFPDSERAYQLLANFNTEKNQYEFLEALLKSENNFLEAAVKGDLSNIINSDKIEMKCYSFERMGIIQRASGMILFDKTKAISLGYGSEIQHITTDIILLNDFLRKYELTNAFGLDFVFAPFDTAKGNNVRDQQSIFLTRQPGGGFNSHLFDQQMASVSSSVAGYRENDFKYKIEEQHNGDNSGGTIVDLLDQDPVECITFTPEERRQVAQAIIESFPEVRTENLESIINNGGRIK